MIDVREIARSEVRQQIQDANIILAIDRSSGHEAVIYGRAMLQDTRGRWREWTPQEPLVFALNMETEELEYLCAAVKVLKGRHDYK